jgi:hypothetical protein
VIARAAAALALVVIMLAGTATLLAYLDRYSWFFEMLTVLRAQYLVLLAIAGLALLTTRHWSLGTLGLILAVCNAVSIAPQFIAPKQPSAGHGRLTLLLFNVQVGNTDYAAARGVIMEQHPDVLGITELSRPWLHALGAELSAYRYRVVAPQNDAYGIGLFSRLPVVSSRIEHLPPDGPPTAVAQLRIGARVVTVVITHPHTPFACTSASSPRSRVRCPPSVARSRSAATSTRRRGHTPSAISCKPGGSSTPTAATASRRPGPRGAGSFVYRLTTASSAATSSSSTTARSSTPARTTSPCASFWRRRLEMAWLRRGDRPTRRPATSPTRFAFVTSSRRLRRSEPGAVTHGLLSHQSDQRGVCFWIGGRDESVRPLVPRAPVEVRDGASCCLADGHARREVHAVADVAVGDVRGSLPGRHPRQSERSGNHPRFEASDELGIARKPHGPESRLVWEWRVEVEIHEPRPCARRKWRVTIIGTHVRRPAIGPEDMATERLRHCGGEHIVCGPQRGIYRNDRHPGGIVERPAKRIDQPDPQAFARAASPQFFASDSISGPLPAKDREHRGLSLDVRSRRKVSGALVDPFQRRPKPTAHNVCSLTNNLNRNVHIAHRRDQQDRETGIGMRPSSPSTEGGAAPIAAVLAASFGQQSE